MPVQIEVKGFFIAGIDRNGKKQAGENFTGLCSKLLAMIAISTC